jgi:site-specific DNA-methyltransferase (adenine-specific)
MDKQIARISSSSSMLVKVTAALAKANTLPEIVELRDQSETIRQYLKRIGESLDLQNTAAEIKLRAERKAGLTLGKILKRGGNPKSHDVTLKKLGVSKMQSSRWQAIASVPNASFEEHILEMKQGKELTSSSVLKLSKELVLAKIRAEHVKHAQTMPSQGHGIITGDNKLLWKRLEDESVDLFFTDPPYGKSSLKSYSDLAELAAAKLKPSGLCLAYCGQMFLPQVIDAMSKHLEYWWIFAIQFAGSHAAIHPRAIQNKWRSILAFAKPPAKPSDEWLSDLLVGGGRNKKRDDWEQDESEAEYLIRKLSKPNDFVVDPFCGTGTFCIAAKSLGRRWCGTETDAVKAKMARARLV